MLQYYSKCGQNPICHLKLAKCLLLANISLSFSQQHGAAEPGTFGQLRRRCGLLRSTASERETKASPLLSKRLRASVCVFVEVALCEGVALMVVSRHGGFSVANGARLSV